jgi:hypothetical protein
VLASLFSLVWMDEWRIKTFIQSLGYSGNWILCLRSVCNLIHFWIIASFCQYLLWCNLFSHFIILSSTCWQSVLWCNKSEGSWRNKLCQAKLTESCK